MPHSFNRSVLLAGTFIFGMSLLLSLRDQAAAAESPSESVASRIRFQWGVKIPLRDGVRLNATLYAPSDARAPRPCLFTLTPYVSQRYHDEAAYFASHGFAFWLVDVRGRGNSEGEFQPFIQEGHDGFDVVEWIAAQPECNGKVGMWGASYQGHDQWFTAKEMPPHLATIVPAAAPFFALDFPMSKNIFSPSILQWFMLVSGRTSQDQMYWGNSGFWPSQFRQWFESGRPFKELDTILGFPSPVFQVWLSHPHQDDYWDRYNPTAEQFRKLQIPVLTITGSYDDDQLGALANYREHQRAASAQAKSLQYLVIGPWNHAGTRSPKLEFDGLTVGTASLVDLLKLHLEWYTWTMKGGPKPPFLQAPVRYYLMGADQWRSASTLESITAETKTFMLDSAGKSANDIFSSGTLTPEGICRSAPDQYVYDPRDISSAELQTHIDPVSITDQQMVFAQSGKALFYHTAPLAQDMQVSGFFRFNAWIGIDQPDTDFLVSVYEIGTDGSSIWLGSDQLRARYRQSLRDPKLVRTRAPQRYDFTRFNFIARTLKKGNRIRLVLAPINSIYAEKNHNAGGTVAEESIADSRVVTVRLYHDRAHPSQLVVPIGDPSEW